MSRHAQFRVVLGVELRAWHMQSKYSISQATFSPQFTAFLNQAPKYIKITDFYLLVISHDARAPSLCRHNGYVSEENRKEIQSRQLLCRKTNAESLP